jgi:hypothetical protein
MKVHLLSSKVVPELDVVVNSNIPAPPPSEATEIALNLIGPAITAVPVLPAVDLVACMSDLKLILFSLY